MKATIFKTFALLVPAFLVACQPPRAERITSKPTPKSSRKS